MDFILKKLEPSFVTIGGTAYPLFFSLRAAAMMEEQLQKPYAEILAEMFQLHDESEPTPPPMAMERQAEVVACLLREGGVSVEAEDLKGLHMAQFTELCNGAVKEMMNKMPRGGKRKNG